MSAPTEDIKITIIGGGLSAIYSYWGCLDAGYKTSEIEVIYSARANPIGAVFMYESPLAWPPTSIVSILLGTADQYSKNQWGDLRRTSAHVRFSHSPAVVEQLYVYEEMKTTLWSMMILRKESAALTDDYISNLKYYRRAVIATFANSERRKEYTNKNFAIQFPIYINSINSDKHVVLYNGFSDIPWVRQTISLGRSYTEYPSRYCNEPTVIMSYEHSRDNRNGNLTMTPDLHPDCPNLEWDERIEGNLLRVGRFATFTPGYLSHQARHETTRFLNEL
jgi:hypothetical protein